MLVSGKGGAILDTLFTFTYMFCPIFGPFLDQFWDHFGTIFVTVLSRETGKGHADFGHSGADRRRINWNRTQPS